MSITNPLNQKESIEVVFIPFNLEGELDSSVTLSSYRIVQEVLNNAVQHSGAKKIIVQITREDNTIQIIVEDDGKGFIMKKADKNVCFTKTT